MLNPFPTMWLSLLAFFLLRLITGITLVMLGIRHIKKKELLEIELKSFLPNYLASARILILIEVLVGGFIIAGYHTQYTCLVGIALSMFFIIFRKRFLSTLLPTRLYYVMLFGALISIFITGAGAFAFDLPI